MLIGDHVSRLDRDSLAVRWSATFPHVLGDGPGSLLVLREPTGKSQGVDAGTRSARVVVVRDVHVRMYDTETGEEVGHFVRPEDAGSGAPTALCEAEGGEALVVYGARTVAFHPTKKIATVLADVAPSERTPCEAPDAHCDVGVSCKVPASTPRGLPAGCLAAVPAGRNLIAYCPTAAVGRIVLVDPSGKRLFEKENADLNSSKSFEFFSLRRDVLHLASEGTLFTFDSADGTLLWSKPGKFRAGYRQMGRFYGEVDGRVVALDARTGQQLAVVGGR
jgi:outer membrane protein assembly factor BamB